MQETLKAMRRRWCEHESDGFPWKKIFKGRMIDIGCEPCPLPFPDVTAWDLEQGDANDMRLHFSENFFDLVHASQVLEHMHDPIKSLQSWIAITKPKGCVVVTVPCMELYGDILWGPKGSKFNPDHKSTFSYGLKRSGAPIHVHIPTLVDAINTYWNARVLHHRVVDSNYDYGIGFTRDQTLDETAMVEAWIELVIQKHDSHYSDDCLP